MGRTVCLPTFIVDLYGHSCREIYQSIPVPWIRHGYWNKKTWNFQVCFFCTATDLSPLPWDPVSLKLLQLSSVDGPSQVWPSLSPLYSLFFWWVFGAPNLDLPKQCKNPQLQNYNNMSIDITPSRSFRLSVPSYRFSALCVLPFYKKEKIRMDLGVPPVN